MIRFREAVRVVLANGLVKWRCMVCGGLYDTKTVASRVTLDGGASGGAHHCAARPR